MISKHISDDITPPLNENLDYGYRHSNACSFVCFVALRPKSTAMVMAGWSVHLTTHFLGQA